MNIDIDRLHKVADGSLVGRRQGHTLLSVTNLAALVSVHTPVVYCVLSTLDDTEHIKQLITRVFAHYELPRIEWVGRLHFKCILTKVFFIFSNDIAHALRGVDEKYPVVILFET